MTRMRMMKGMVVVAGVVGLAGVAQSAVLCQKKSGAVFVRSDACKKKETTLDLAQFGALGPKGDKGDKGDQGNDGQDLTVSATLPSGQTESGVFSATGNASGFSAFAIEFRPKLPATMPTTNAHYMTGGATNANCPGMGQAASGHLCVYEAGNSTSSFIDFFKITANSGQLVEQEGVLLFWNITAQQSRVWGTWAVTP